MTNQLTRINILIFVTKFSKSFHFVVLLKQLKKRANSNLLLWSDRLSFVHFVPFAARDLPSSLWFPSATLL